MDGRLSREQRDRQIAARREAGGVWRPYVGEVPLEACETRCCTRVPRCVETRWACHHVANDESTDVVRAALGTPVPRVRLVALHGLFCERCRLGAIDVDDVVTDALGVLPDDPNAKVRHAAITRRRA